MKLDDVPFVYLQVDPWKLYRDGDHFLCKNTCYRLNSLRNRLRLLSWMSARKVARCPMNKTNVRRLHDTHTTAYPNLRVQEKRKKNRK